MPSPRKVVVVNLRAQPVEIQHGDEVVVVPEFGHAELEEPDAAQGQLAELARQGAVAVHTAPATRAPAKTPVQPGAGGAKKKPPVKKTPPKKPQGGA